jgi:hypothetical protein
MKRKRLEARNEKDACKKGLEAEKEAVGRAEERKRGGRWGIKMVVGKKHA